MAVALNGAAQMSSGRPVGGVGLGAVEGGPGAAATAPAAGRGVARSDGGLAVLVGAAGPGGRAGDGGPVGAGRRAAPVHVPRGGWGGGGFGPGSPRGAAPAGDGRAALVPRGVRPGPAGLAVVPAGPAARPARDAGAVPAADIPGGDPAAFVRDGMSRGEQELNVVALVSARSDVVARRIGRWGQVTAVSDECAGWRCRPGTRAGSCSAWRSSRPRSSWSRLRRRFATRWPSGPTGSRQRQRDRLDAPRRAR